MTDSTKDEQRILQFLSDSVAKGERYFRAKNIADHLDLSSKQVGARLPKLVEESDELGIEKWGRARSTTWKVEPC
ncbi:hypothetical protein DMJ13_19045 [halophilic archaeon]|nr:hypothetical protein DMJ13_19045 [halophilic archaeon]